MPTAVTLVSVWSTAPLGRATVDPAIAAITPAYSKIPIFPKKKPTAAARPQQTLTAMKAGYECEGGPKKGVPVIK